MFKKHSKFFENLLLISDFIIIGVIWFLSYNIRFYSGLIPVDKGIPPFKIYLYLIVPIAIIWPLVSKSFGLYRPKRVSSYYKEIFDILNAYTFSVILLICFTFFLRQYEYSRLVFFGFWAMALIALLVKITSTGPVLYKQKRIGISGNTDIKKRIEHDLYYIENWSLWFDISRYTIF